MTGAEAAPPSETVLLGGQVMVGGSPSVTVIMKEQVAVLPAESVAVQLTGVAPFWKVEPLAGVQLLVTPQLSLMPTE